MRYENNILEHEILTMLKIGMLAGIVALNNANACGINWQRANSIPQQISMVNSVTYGGGQFVATAGPPGDFLTSPDGVTWTWRTLFGTSVFNDIIWSGNQFVAIGQVLTTSAGIMTSPDGVTWSARNPNTTYPLYGVIWNGSQYVAVGGNYNVLTIRTSSDGVNWTHGADLYDGRYGGTLRSVAWSGNRFVAVGIGRLTGSTYGPAPILVSSDGAAWNLLDPVTMHWALYDVTWGGNQFVAVGGSSSVSGTGIKAVILTSPNGLNWTPRDSGTTNDLRSVAWNGNQFVVVGSNGTILTSADGVSWTPRNSGTTSSLYGVTWGGISS